MSVPSWRCPPSPGGKAQLTAATEQCWAMFYAVEKKEAGRGWKRVGVRDAVLDRRAPKAPQKSWYLNRSCH